MRRVAVVMAALFAVGCGGKADEERRREDPKLLYDRVWIDRLPEKRTDYMHGMFVLGQRPFGGFHKASSYDFHFEVFVLLPRLHDLIGQPNLHGLDPGLQCLVPRSLSEVSG